MTAGARSDEELMLAYGAGDREAFEELFERYRDRIYRYLLRHHGDWTVAEDLFQRTFLKMHEARRRYRPTSSFASWIYTIATNLLRDEARSRGASTIEPAGERPIPERADETSAPDGPALGRELAERIATAVRQLPPDQREAFVLGKYEGLGYREVAQILGCSEGAVKVRIHRALKALGQVVREHVHAM